MRSVVGALLLLFGLAGLAEPNDPSPPKKLGLMTFLERPLVDVRDQKPVGLAVSIIEELMRRTNVAYTIRLVPPKRAILIAQRTPGFCVFPAERSQERETLFQWVSPVLISRHGLYARPERPLVVRTLADARPYVLGSYLGSGVGEYLDSFGFTVEYATRNELNAEKLLRDRIDLWVSDTLSARYIANEKKMALGQPALVFFTTVRAMGCHPDTDRTLIARLQSTLLEMYRSGEIDRIYRQFDGRLLK